jgi:hypothetical protein
VLDGFQIRRYQAGDEEGIHRLLQDTFPKWKSRPLDFWRWKYLESSGGEYVYLALDGEAIIGVICELPIKIKIGSEVVLGVYSDDTATDKRYRGRGIYSKLDRYAREHKSGIEHFYYWETENPIIAGTADNFSDRLFPFQLRRMLKVSDIELYLKNRDRNTLFNRLGFSLLEAVNGVKGTTRSSLDSNRDYSIAEVDAFDERINVFWEKVKQGYNYIVEKRLPYLLWRYSSYGSKEYSIRLATRDDEVLGYIVLRNRVNNEEDEGTIMDLLALNDRSDVAAGLLDEALVWYEQQGTNSVYLPIVGGHPYYAILGGKGFIDVSGASKSQIFYNFSTRPGFDHDKFASYPPRTIQFITY